MPLYQFPRAARHASIRASFCWLALFIAIGRSGVAGGQGVPTQLLDRPKLECAGDEVEGWACCGTKNGAIGVGSPSDTHKHTAIKDQVTCPIDRCLLQAVDYTKVGNVPSFPISAGSRHIQESTERLERDSSPQATPIRSYFFVSEADFFLSEPSDFDFVSFLESESLAPESLAPPSREADSCFADPSFEVDSPLVAESPFEEGEALDFLA
jgi:hypothetical protein